MSARIAEVAAAHPATVSRFSIGRSYGNRELWAVKLSDNVALDELEPEALFVWREIARNREPVLQLLEAAETL
jgi:carboxypeptidase T